jgi:hypothetical protein
MILFPASSLLVHFKEYKYIESAKNHFFLRNYSAKFLLESVENRALLNAPYGMECRPKRRNGCVKPARIAGCWTQKHTPANKPRAQKSCGPVHQRKFISNKADISSSSVSPPFATVYNGPCLYGLFFVKLLSNNATFVAHLI